MKRKGLDWIGISIHAPRGGSDLRRVTRKLWICDISIHAPRGGSDDVLRDKNT